MKINRNRYSHNFKSTIFIDFQYQSINCYWLLLIIIDFIDYRKPLIDNAGLYYQLLVAQSGLPSILIKCYFYFADRELHQDRALPRSCLSELSLHRTVRCINHKPGPSGCEGDYSYAG